MTMTWDLTGRPESTVRSMAPDRRESAHGVTITGVDIPFWDLAAIAIKLAVIWVAFGAVAYGIYILVN